MITHKNNELRLKDINKQLLLEDGFTEEETWWLFLLT